MPVLDTSITAVTLPRMQGTFSATQDEISIVITAYLVAIVIMTPLAGAASVRFGRRRLLLIAIAGFVVCAAIAAQSTSLLEICVIRFIQGLFGGVLVPLGQAIVLDTHPKEELGGALGWLGMFTVFGYSIGPMIGGFATEMQSWRLGFYISVPVGLITFFMVYSFIPEAEKKAEHHINYFGFSMFALGLGLLQIMLSRGTRLDWLESTEIVVTAGLSAICLYLFVTHTATARQPFIDPKILLDRNFVLGLILVFAFVWMMMSILVLFPAYLQDLLGYPIEAAGLVMGIRAAASMPGNLLAGVMVKWIEPRWIVALGFTCVAIGAWRMSQFTLAVDYWDIMVACIIFGIGSGFSFVPINIATFSTLHPRYRADGTSLFALMRNVGGSIAVTVMVTLLVESTQANHSLLTRFVTPYSEGMQHSELPAAWALDSAAGLSAIDKEVTRQALLLAYVHDFQLLAIFSAACVLLVFFMRPARTTEGR